MAPKHSLELLTSLPAFTTPEQHLTSQESTPSTFEAPPVLRRKQSRVNVQLNPSLPSFPELAAGKEAELYISEGSLVVFVPAMSKGVSVPYPAIALHAVSRQPMRPWQPVNGDIEASPLADVGLAGGPCIYCQIDEAGGDRAEGEEEDEENGVLRDLVLTPQDASTIEPIFEALSHCASLFPSTMSDDEGPAFADADVEGQVNGHTEVEDSEVGAVRTVRGSRYEPY